MFIIYSLFIQCKVDFVYLEAVDSLLKGYRQGGGGYKGRGSGRFYIQTKKIIYRQKTKRDIVINYSLNVCFIVQYKLAFVVFSGAIRRVLREAIPTIPVQLMEVWNCLDYII